MCCGGRGSERFGGCFLFWLLSEKLVQRKSACAHTGNRKSNLVNWAHEMACVVLCYMTDPIKGKLAKNFVSSFLFGVFRSVSMAGKDLVSTVK